MAGFELFGILECEPEVPVGVLVEVLEQPEIMAVPANRPVVFFKNVRLFILFPFPFTQTEYDAGTYCNFYEKIMNSQQPRPNVKAFNFGEFNFDAAEQTLTNMQGKITALSTRLNDLLLYMVERPGQLLSKEDLFDNIWHKVIVEENSLNQAIATLRKKLDDTKNKRQYIETVSGKGYRFLMPVINSSEVQEHTFNLAQEIKYCQTSDGVSLAYSVIGEGYPVILLPTWVGHLKAQFENPVSQHYLMELASRYQLIRFDSRGFGMSERNVSDVTFEDYLTDIETVVDHLDLEKFAMLGPSAGGLLSTAYALRHPERVGYLILLNGFIRGVRTLGDPAADAHADLIESVIRRGWGENNSEFSKIFCTMLIPDGTPEQHQQLDYEQHIASSGKNAESYFKVMAKVDISEEVKSMKVPTLILSCISELGVPRSESELMASLIPNAQFVALPSKNHILLPTEAAWPIFTKALHDFIGA